MPRRKHEPKVTIDLHVDPVAFKEALIGYKTDPAKWKEHLGTCFWRIGYGIAFHRKRGTDYDDAGQNAAMIGFKHIDKYSPDGNAFAYFYTMILNSIRQAERAAVYYQGIVDGYRDHMLDSLTSNERDSVVKWLAYFKPDIQEDHYTNENAQL